MADAPKCPDGTHKWGPEVPVRDKDFGVTFGILRTCEVCRWRHYDDFAANRSSGVERILPPDPPADGVEVPRG